MMADKAKEDLLRQVKEQGDLVRKLKAAKEKEPKGSSNILTDLKSLNNDFADISYVCGWVPSSKDTQLFNFCTNFYNENFAKWPHLNRWYINMKSFTESERSSFPVLEDLVTPLAKKLKHIGNNSCCNNNMLDKKVRQLATCKQLYHRLLTTDTNNQFHNLSSPNFII